MYSFISMGHCCVVCIVLCLSFLRRENIGDCEVRVGMLGAVMCGLCLVGHENNHFLPPAFIRSASREPRVLCGWLPASLTSPL